MYPLLMLADLVFCLPVPSATLPPSAAVSQGSRVPDLLSLLELFLCYGPSNPALDDYYENSNSSLACSHIHTHAFIGQTSPLQKVTEDGWRPQNPGERGAGDNDST